MFDIKTIKKVYKQFRIFSIYGSVFLTSVYFLITYGLLAKYDKSEGFFDELINLIVKSPQELLILVLFFLVLLFLNFVISLLWMYLLISSVMISKRYSRFVHVFVILIFILTFLHIFPNLEFNESYSLRKELGMRLIQGLTLTSMVIVFWSFIQNIILYIVGSNENVE